jgi:SAM-dependent methyltransferase
MAADHDHLWTCMINHVVEQDLSRSKILDYGCNQGRFLKKLHAMRPFLEGVGVDVVSDPVAEANKETTHQPVSYYDVSALSNYEGHFDMAFSHEVLYLLDDLKVHAELIGKSLKPGGVYYAAIGCHTENPDWDRWAKMISEYSNIPVQNYSLNDYADAFFDAGFRVSARSYRFDGFVPLKKNNDYFPLVRDSLDYHDRHKVLFRFVKGV